MNSKRHFEFTESDPMLYLLMMNGRVWKVYDRSKFSKSEAEEKAAKEVKKAQVTYGINNVRYDSCVTVK